MTRTFTMAEMPEENDANKSNIEKSLIEQRDYWEKELAEKKAKHDFLFNLLSDKLDRYSAIVQIVNAN